MSVELEWVQRQNCFVRFLDATLRGVSDGREGSRRGEGFGRILKVCGGLNPRLRRFGLGPPPPTFRLKVLVIAVISTPAHISSVGRTGFPHQ